VACSSCVPNALIVPGTWAFRCKRCPDGTFQKFKSKWCVRGDIERCINSKSGEEVMDTYSPVVQWSSVLLVLVLTIFLDMVTQAVNFSNAFAQADMAEELDVYLEMPENFKTSDNSDSVLKLKKSLYREGHICHGRRRRVNRCMTLISISGNRVAVKFPHHK
jgi:hypothetical protein